MVEDKFKKETNCGYCGKEMEAKYRSKKFCSDKCRVYFGRDKKAHDDGRNNPFENAARGRDENGVNNDEVINNSDLITKYETELSGLGDGQFAKARKKWLMAKISELKYGR